MIGMARGIPRQAVAGSLDMMNAALPQAFFHGGDRIIIKQGREETARLPDDGIDNGRQKRSVVSFVDSSSWVYIAVLILLVAFSGFFSATETAFTTINRIRLKTMAAAGSKRAALVLRMAEDYDRLLSTILIGNNIVNIASASIATVVFVRFLGDKGVTISTVVMTVVVLIFGEISPKSLAKQNAESFAMLAAPLLRVFLVVFKPLNWLFLQWKKLLNRVFRPRADTGMTGEELKVMVDEVQSGGSIDEHEGELIRSAIEFNDLDVEDILTPRVQVVAVEERDTLEEISDKFLQNGYSRMLVYRHTIDTLLGVIHEKDFYTLLHEGGKMCIRDSCSPGRPASGKPTLAPGISSGRAASAMAGRPCRFICIIVTSWAAASTERRNRRCSAGCMRPRSGKRRTRAHEIDSFNLSGKAAGSRRRLFCSIIFKSPFYGTRNSVYFLLLKESQTDTRWTYNI